MLLFYVRDTISSNCKDFKNWNYSFMNLHRNYTSPNGEARSRPKARARSKTFYSYSIFKDLKYFTHSFMNFDRNIYQTQDLKWKT